ncbi:hypothetical protein [Aureibacter tunicatorum]|uniref:Uncharacterized protein n=1 Tax=Aureibacter tunicatorum TaxID=866807 RepID=A0AAE4BR14_9BACT|nr:hypothetical protein [Aureibacter tunicatorum]MDR6237463.1 hypothetical protein [Aureibacter tunicatorum]
MNKPEIIDSKDDEHDFKHEFWSFKFENGKWDHLNAIPFETINQEDNKLAHVPGIGIHEDKMYLMGDGNTLGIYEIQKNNNNVTIELIDSINVKRDIPMDLPSIRINKLIRQNNHLIILSSFHSKERKAKINKHYDPNKTLSFKKVFYNPKINFLNHYKFDSNTKEYKLVPKDTLTFINEHGQYKWGTNLDEHHFLDDISNDTLTKYVIYKIFYDEQKGINRNITREFIFDQEQEILPIDSNSFYFFSEEINPQNEYIFNENTIDTLRFNALPNYAHYTQQVRTTANQLIILKHYEENIDPETLIINSDAFKNKEIGINELCGERIEFLKNRRYRSKIFFLNTSN